MNRELSPYTPPAWASGLAGIPRVRIPLAQKPTPVRPWQALPGMPDIDLWIKRDDLTGIALSGNKARKLEFLLADALNQGCDAVITAGGIQSNHCRATAVAARQLGLDCHLVLNTPDIHSDPGFAGNLLLDRLVGAEIHLITYQQFLLNEEFMGTLADDLRQRGKRPYVIPVGGSNALGTWGYLEAVRELMQAADTGGLEFDDILFACGSGGTAAGIALGCWLAKLPVRVHAVCVCADAAHFYGHIDEIYGALAAGVTARDTLDIVEGYVGRGYALNRPEELELIGDVARRTGIVLDPVYSGKAFFGLRRELEIHRDRFKGDRILFVHTGGLFGLYAKLDELAEVLP